MASAFHNQGGDEETQVTADAPGSVATLTGINEGGKTSMPAPKGLHAEFMDRLNYYIWLGLTLLVVTVLVWLILRIRSWFIDSDDSNEPLQEMLGQFRQLQREGELSDEEYRLISQQLSAAQGPPDTSKTISQLKRKQQTLESDHSTDPSGS